MAHIIAGEWRSLFGACVDVDPTSIELRFLPSQDASQKYVALPLRKYQTGGLKASVVTLAIQEALQIIGSAHDLNSVHDIFVHNGAIGCMSSFVFAARSNARSGTVLSTPCLPVERLKCAFQRQDIELPTIVLSKMRKWYIQSMNKKYGTLTIETPKPPCYHLELQNWPYGLHPWFYYPQRISLVCQLDLSRSGLNDVIGPLVVESIMYAPMLEKLDLRWNILSDRTALWLKASCGQGAQSKTSWPKLKHLHLHGNAFTSINGALDILETASFGLQQLHHLDFSVTAPFSGHQLSVKQRQRSRELKGLCQAWKKCQQKLETLSITWQGQRVDNLMSLDLHHILLEGLNALSESQRLRSLCMQIPSKMITSKFLDEAPAWITCAKQSECLSCDDVRMRNIDLSGSASFSHNKYLVPKLIQLIRQGHNSTVCLRMRLCNCGLDVEIAQQIARIWIPPCDNRDALIGLKCLDISENQILATAGVLVLAKAAINYALKNGNGIDSRPVYLEARSCGVNMNVLIEQLTSFFKPLIAVSRRKSTFTLVRFNFRGNTSNLSLIHI